MRYSVALFVTLFAVIWLMHKPFNVHHAKPWLNRLHEYLELALIMQGVVVVNQLLGLL